MKRTMTTCPPRARGTATVLALALIGLSASALIAMASEYGAFSHSTREMLTRGQLRQMLQDGAIHAVRRAEGISRAEQTVVALPDTLTEASAALRLRWSPPTATTRTVHISAVYRGSTAEQTLTLARDDGRWTVREVQTRRLD